MTAHDVRLRDPRTLTSLPEILSCLSAYQSEEADLSSSLSDLLSARDPIINSLARLTTLVPLIDDLHGEAALLANKVSQTAQTAERVGGRVRSLDEEMKRIREASDRVGQVVELKFQKVVPIALQASIESKDWDSATRHCARAMTLPPEVIGGPFAEQAVPTSESHLPPAQTLQEAREHLLRVFRQQFKQASESRDSAVISRFFKLFPAIGWEVEGLEVYAAFVVDLVRVRPLASAKSELLSPPVNISWITNKNTTASSPMYYITALTALYESVAMIVDQHQPVVEKYYGLDGASDSDSGKEGDTNIHTDAEAVRCIEKSGSNKLFMELLSTCYMPMEVWYLRPSGLKPRLEPGPSSTTTPDDVFYVLKVVLSRSLSTGSLATVEKATSQLRDVMEQDYAGGIKKKLDDVYRPSASSGNRGERAEAENRISFIAKRVIDVLERPRYINVSCRTVDQRYPRLAYHSSALCRRNQPLVKSYLSSFAGVGNKFTSILRLIRPKLRTFLVDIYRDVSYVLDDNGYAAAEYQDVVRKKFIKSWEGFMEAYKVRFYSLSTRRIEELKGKIGIVH
ncbi:COG4 transport protein-domain-containing protein [Salix suchowensis]|nr:COG4 transport protein-domain-containing protein [Salix suchowensis]